MSRRPKYAKQRDKNEPDIVAAFEAHGCSVTRLDGEAGLPDLLVGCRGRTLLVEVKVPAGPRGGTKHHHAELKDDQVKWWKAWQGEEPFLVRTVADVDALIAYVFGRPQAGAA